MASLKNAHSNKLRPFLDRHIKKLNCTVHKSVGCISECMSNPWTHFQEQVETLAIFALAIIFLEPVKTVHSCHNDHSCITKNRHCNYVEMKKIFNRVLATSQMVLNSSHLHTNISRYFTELVQIYLFITVTHLLITPPISNNFYTSKFNNIFHICDTLRFNTSSM
jgi:hypothetical protein